MKTKEKFFAASLIISVAISGAIIAGNQLKPLIMTRSAAYAAPVVNETVSAETVLVEEIAAEPVFVPQTAGPDASSVLDLNALDAPQEADTADDAEDALPAAEGLSSLGWLDDYEFVTVDHSYFSDALFIGDSRTVGIRLYGGLTEPVYFASTGMSVFSVTKDTVDVRGYGKLSLNQILKKKTFGKIYIMLGINELSSEKDSILVKYQTVIDTVRAEQPDAMLYLCANLHVTGKKSATDKVFNNDRVNALNDGIAALAAENCAYYIDVNSVYDDEGGNLAAEYASDFAHMYGKYYGMWVDWLCTKGIAE